MSKYIFHYFYNPLLSKKRIDYLSRLNLTGMNILQEELLFRKKEYLFNHIQSLPLGKTFQDGDPVILPNIHNVKKPIHCTFSKYLTTSGSDRKVELMVDGERKEAWLSFIIPDMNFWFREILNE